MKNTEGLKLGWGWNKGKKRWWKSYSFKKGQKAHLGYKHSEKSKKLISEHRKGIKHSEATKKKMLGRIPWNKGKKNTKMIGNTNGFKKGLTPWNKGLKGFLMGEKNPMWKGGITPVYMSIRHSFENKTLMKKIKERDNYTCQICGERGKKLHVDHYPISFAQIIKQFNIKSLEEALNCPKMWDENNLRTLCLKCHKLTDTYLKSLKGDQNGRFISQV